MKDIPALFNGPMVRGILENRKRMTRRIMKPQPVTDGKAWGYYPGKPNHLGEYGVAAWGLNDRPAENSFVLSCCPYGGPGSKLWVRETWALPPDYNPVYHGDLKTKPRIGPVCFRADYPTWHPWPGTTWRPSILMPRWASRITLENTAVRVERLQDISEEDAIAEGIESCPGNHKEGAVLYKDYMLPHIEQSEWFASPIRSFESLWTSINGLDSWAANPWVWVIEFRKIKPE